MILKTQTYNHDMGFISKDEIKLLGEDRIINLHLGFHSTNTFPKSSC